MSYKQGLALVAAVISMNFADARADMATGFGKSRVSNLSPALPGSGTGGLPAILSEAPKPVLDIFTAWRWDFVTDAPSTFSGLVELDRRIKALETYEQKKQILGAIRSEFWKTLDMWGERAGSAKDLDSARRIAAKVDALVTAGLQWEFYSTNVEDSWTAAAAAAQRAAHKRVLDLSENAVHKVASALTEGGNRGKQAAWGGAAQPTALNKPARDVPKGSRRRDGLWAEILVQQRELDAAPVDRKENIFRKLVQLAEIAGRNGDSKAVDLAMASIKSEVSLGAYRTTSETYRYKSGAAAWLTMYLPEFQRDVQLDVIRTLGRALAGVFRGAQTRYRSNLLSLLTGLALAERVGAYDLPLQRRIVADILESSDAAAQVEYKLQALAALFSIAKKTQFPVIQAQIIDGLMKAAAKGPSRHYAGQASLTVYKIAMLFRVGMVSGLIKVENVEQAVKESAISVLQRELGFADAAAKPEIQGYIDRLYESAGGYEHTYVPAPDFVIPYRGESFLSWFATDKDGAKGNMKLGWGMAALFLGSFESAVYGIYLSEPVFYVGLLGGLGSFIAMLTYAKGLWYGRRGWAAANAAGQLALFGGAALLAYGFGPLSMLGSFLLIAGSLGLAHFNWKSQIRSLDSGTKIGVWFFLQQATSLSGLAIFYALMYMLM